VIRPGDEHAQIPVTGAAITPAETTTDRVTVEVNLPPGGPLSGMAADVRAGLTRPFKELSPRYFYDEHGSELFERITELEEYYPTRCEREILQTRAGEICEAANRPASLIELGSGSARKTRVLLDAMRCAGCLKTYCPVDISEEITRDTAERIAREYEGVNVRGLVCDFEFDLERIPVGGPRVIALLGGTIGNFAPHQRAGFLRRISNLLGPEDRFLLGTDLVKDRAILEAAYNDSKGITAEFNKNVLAVLNRELDADFDLDSFEHVARWDPENLWMDIRLRSLVNQVVNVSALDMLIPFAAGEEMRTEISTKFLRPGLEGIYAEAGLELTDWWTDAEGLYALSLARSVSSSS
jgi:L-histidine Nalpha-methyltransferase